MIRQLLAARLFGFSFHPLPLPLPFTPIPLHPYLARTPHLTSGFAYPSPPAHLRYPDLFIYSAGGSAGSSRLPACTGLRAHTRESQKKTNNTPETGSRVMISLVLL